ncbi:MULTISPECIES: hypothetical protein [unclassified Bradyrhizobium]|uniref:hypothetical protein n=1 Tax=unclassified Bradyrhizobium TaxID=2631580 RepID=UPI0028E48F61|nr:MULTISPECIES: hypothetical protein [unclassified Bradyrhizobium]
MQGVSCIFATARWLVVLAIVLIIVPPGKSHALQGEADWDFYHLTVEYCRGPLQRPIASGPDRRIVCFDGWIDDGMDLSAIQDLQDGGLFVVRSFGGHAVTAMTLARLLQDRQATVVVYDYCMAACASFLLMAPDQAYVTDGSIVAWRLVDDPQTECVSVGDAEDERGKRLRRIACPDSSSEQQQKINTAIRAERAFYAARAVKRKFEGPPDSPYTRRAVRNLYDQFGTYRKVAWTLHPKYNVFFKTRILYEAYPVSQDEVDVLAARHRLGKVIHDP